MEKRFQVFVSSTFRDLEDERQEVMRALLELDCIPSGMELFPAADQSQWELIKKVIDDCDYYILIVAGRYGTVGPEGISYTEQEYQYANKTGKPTISFVHRNPQKLSVEHSESTEDGRSKLAAFRSVVEKKLCKHWEGPHELGSVVSRSLVQIMKSRPAVGWIRADAGPGEETTLELLKARRQIEQLEGELARSRVSAPEGAEHLAKGDEVHGVVVKVYVTPPGDYTHRETFEETIELTWDEIFAAIAPKMIQEAQEAELIQTLDSFFKRNYELPQEWATAGTATGVKITQESFQEIKVQFRALGYITKSERNRSIKDPANYWSLTPYGDSVMTRLIAIRSVERVDTKV